MLNPQLQKSLEQQGTVASPFVRVLEGLGAECSNC